MMELSCRCSYLLSEGIVGIMFHAGRGLIMVFGRILSELPSLHDELLHLAMDTKSRVWA